MKPLKSIAVLLLLSFLMFNCNAQNTILKIWPAGIPGAIINDTYIEKISESNGLATRIEKVTDPTLYVFLPQSDKATGKAVLICPGGGYGFLSFINEGFPIAKWLNDNGIAAIILKYRLPSDLIMKDKSVGPLQDAQEAIRIIRRNAVVWNLNPGKVGVMGFSAGGHLASTLSTHFAEKVYEAIDTTSARPDFSLLIYPVITMDAAFTHGGTKRSLLGDNPTEDAIKRFSNELQITEKTPPTFLVHAADDKAVPVKNSIVYFEGLLKNNISAELHIFQKGGHGFGLALNGGTESAWPDLTINWLKKTIK
jgi:acetyl esterase/lipase